jgi:hypothetical protein
MPIIQQNIEHVSFELTRIGDLPSAKGIHWAKVLVSWVVDEKWSG